MKHRTLGWLLAAAGAVFTCNAAPAGVGCAPDTDGSGDISVPDLLNVLANWGPCPGCPADINGDNVVDLLDLALLLDCWGPCPCPPPVNGEIFDETVVVDVTDATAAGLGLAVTHLYATGRLVNVGDALLIVEANLTPNMNTTFYQDPFGNDTPPVTIICDIVPSACYDTFVTNRHVVDDASPVVVAPGSGLSTTSINAGWFVDPTQVDREAVDISGVTGTPGQAGVLIAQVTLVLPPPGEGPSSVAFGGPVNMWAVGAGGAQGSQSNSAFIYCPWDCQPQPDGAIGISDFLALLAQWPAPPGASCDFNFDGVVGINDFLALLARVWGPCPG